MKKQILLLIFLVLFLMFSGNAQTNNRTLPESTSPTSEPPPGDIELLYGYSHIRHRSIDSRGGEITKSGGMTINYDIGIMAGLFAGRCAPRNECQWYKGQKINGREVWLSLTKDGRIFATFPKEYANFYAQTNSPEDIADFLMMVLTYKVKEPDVSDKTETQKLKQK